MTNTARLIAAGITRVPFSLKNAEAYCAGKRLEVRNCLLPMCIGCAIRDPGGRMDPPAVRGAGGVWGCSMADTAVPGASVGGGGDVVGMEAHEPNVGDADPAGYPKDRGPHFHTAHGGVR